MAIEAKRKPNLMPVFLVSLGIAVIPVVIAALSNVAILRVSDPKQLQAHPEQILAVGFDLVIASWAIILSAYYSDETNSNLRQNLMVPSFFIFGLFMCALVVLIGVTDFMVDSLKKKWLAIGLPNLIGLIAVAISVSAVVRHRRSH
jgi:hypothetical protein